MPKKVSIQNAEHYDWGANSEGWHLLATEDLSVIEERVPSGDNETRHYHRDAQQFFYVLDGVAEIDIDGETFSLSKGEGIHIPAGTPHQLMNNSEHEVRFLVTSQPKSHGDRTDA